VLNLSLSDLDYGRPVETCLRRADGFLGRFGSGDWLAFVPGLDEIALARQEDHGGLYTTQTGVPSGVMPYSWITSGTSMRMQPCEAAEPIDQGSSVP
jgi:hypothetical protein